ncbi:hypothetical protein ACFVVQ_09545 [Paenibacillus chitinolyticus]|uniref:hypothetical protein n=1 Tax=Paenibacillus chitinolyticus TaxID=79263 RepID=UPI0036DED185
MSFSRVKLALFLPVITVMLSSCGTRGLPTITEQQLASKHSVLVVTASDVTQETKTSVAAALAKWRSGSGLTSEWKQDAAFDSAMGTLLESKRYDYVVVIGSSLVPQASAEAVRLKNQKFVVLADRLEDPGMQAEKTAPPNTVLRGVDLTMIEQAMSGWVKDQADKRKSIEWVTKSSVPIPSGLSPSGLSGHTVNTDNNPEWFDQLKKQAAEHRSSWIIQYTALQKTDQQKIKSLGIPVVPLDQSFAVQVNWEAVMAQEQNRMIQGDWKPGIQTYSAEEMKQVEFLKKS